MTSKQGRSKIRWILASGVAAGATVLLVWWAGPERVRAASAAIGWRGCLWLLALYTISQAARTWRVQLGFPREERPGFFEIFAITNLHQFSNHLIPARLGEFAFPFLLHRRSGIPPEQSLALLLRIRMQEVFVLGVLFIAALTRLATGAHSEVSRSVHWAPLIAIGGATLLIPLLVERAIPRLAAWGATLTDRMTVRVRHPRLVGWSTRIASGLKRLGKATATPTTTGKRIATFLLTVVVWILIYGLFHEAMRLSGHPVSLAATIVGASFANLAQVLPVNTLGSIGSMEAGWTLGFGLVGVQPQLALATAIIVHALVLAFLALFCIPSWLWLRRRRHVKGNAL